MVDERRSGAGAPSAEAHRVQDRPSEDGSGPAAARGRGSADAGDPSQKVRLDPLIGRVISDRFKITAVIARGGMGKVYRAEQVPLGRACALKVLSPKYQGDQDPEFCRRFFLEASTASKINHPNTVTIFDFGKTEDDIYYIAMEYIEGRTLYRTLRDEGPFSEIRAAHIAKQICRGLREAHKLGVVHRDLKPGNVLLVDQADERDYVKVLDFGLVKDVSAAAEDLTEEGLFMGSPKYMAPEQILGNELSPRTDIYALGVMLFEMLTGKVPFDRGQNMATLMAHVNDRVPPMRVVNPRLDISRQMESIVQTCLEKDPGKRFASMDAVLLALKRTSAGEMFTDTHESLPRVSAGPSAGVAPRTSPPPLPPLPPVPVAGRAGVSSGPPGPASSPEAGDTAVEASPPSSDAPTQVAPPPIAFFEVASEAARAPKELPAMVVPPPAPEAPSAASLQPLPLEADIPREALPRRAVTAAIVAVAALCALAVAVLAGGASQTHGQAQDQRAAADPGAKDKARPAAASGDARPAVARGPVEGAPAAEAMGATTAADDAARVVRVESDPPGAKVTEGAATLCEATPCDVKLAGGAASGGTRTLSFAKAGFLAREAALAPGDTKVSAKLEQPPPASPPKPISAPRPAGRTPGGDWKHNPY